MQLGVARSLERWAATWARRRQGADAHAIALKRRRIYILPTRFGVVFGAMVFAMLLGSLNYGASLGFTLTFLLTGLGLVVMHHCHNNLLGTTIKFLGAAPVFAGERAEFKIAVCNDAAAARFEIELTYRAHLAGPVDVANGGTEVLRIGVPTERRGWIALDRFRVETRYPARLFRAWTWVHMDTRCLVYPRPADPGRPLPSGGGGGIQGTQHAGDDDFAGLRSAAPGDPPQRIAWKAYARNDLLLLKEFSSGAGEPCLLDWDAAARARASSSGSPSSRAGASTPTPPAAASRCACPEDPSHSVKGRSTSRRASRRWPCSTRGCRDDARSASAAMQTALPLRRRSCRSRRNASCGRPRSSSAPACRTGRRSPAWIPVLLLTAIAWRFGVGALRLARTAAQRALLLAIGAFLAVLLRYRTLNGVEAGSALLVVMIALKFLESRDQRDQLVLIMISYFLLFASLLTERGPLLVVYAVARSSGSRPWRCCRSAAAASSCLIARQARSAADCCCTRCPS